MRTIPGQGVSLDEQWLSASETVPEADDTGGHLLRAFPEPGSTSSLKDDVPQGTTEEMEEKLSSAKRKSRETWRPFPNT